MLATAALSVYLLALLAASVSDLTRYEIPNPVSLIAVAAFALTLPTLPLWTSLAHISTGLTFFAVGTALFVLNIWGGGDAKLLGAAALWTGWNDLASFVLLMALAGAVLALALIVLRRLIQTAPVGRWYSRLLSKSEGIPYGVAIAIAAALVVLLPTEPVAVQIAALH